MTIIIEQTTEASMLYPMFAMVMLTLIVGIITVKVRFASVKNREVAIKYYSLMEGENIPDIITKTTRHLNNQFEVPVLFYVVATLYISLGLESSLANIIAWAFVISRYIHSYIHLTYNHIIHRMVAFWVAFVCVIALWVNLMIKQA